MTSSLLSRAGVAAATLALACTLAACGGSDGGSDGGSGSDDSDSSDTRAVPSEDDLTGALLTADDVPEGFVQGEPDDESDSDIFDDTCLADVAKFDDQVGSEPESKVTTEFTTADDPSAQAQVSAGISVYDDEDAVTDAFGAFYDSLDGCTNISFTDENGIAYDIDVSIDDAVTLDGVDSQLTIDLSGSITAGDQMLPVDFGFLVVRNGAATSNLGTSEIGEGFDVNDQIEALAQTQADRLADVLG